LRPCNKVLIRNGKKNQIKIVFYKLYSEFSVIIFGTSEKAGFTGKGRN